MSNFEIKMTRDQLEKARTLLQQNHGIKLEGDSGELSQSGVTIDYSFNGTDSLKIDVKHKPFIFPQSKVEAAIRSWFADIA